MENRAFDKWIKDKLGEIQPEYNVSSWDSMSSKLNKEDDKILDETIKLGLAEISLNYDPTSWEKMSTTLDQEQQAEDSKFDELIKLGLTQGSPKHPVQDWENLSTQLDALDNEFLDETVKEKLNEISPEYHEKEWAEMEETIEKDESKRRELLLIKIVEVVLVFFSLWTLFQLFPSEEKYSKPIDWNEPIASQTLKKTKDAAFISPTQITPTTQSEIVEKKNVPANSETHTTSINNKGTIKKHILNTNNDAPISSIKTTTSKTLTVVENLETPMLNNESAEPVKISKYTPVQTVADDKAITIKTSLPSLQLKPQQAKKGLKLSFSGGLDWNYVHTPYNSEVKQSFSQGNYGFSLGVKTSMYIKWWELETGVGFIHKSYLPTSIFKVKGNVNDGYEAETVNKIQFNILALPLNMRFFLSHPQNQWKFYVHTGASWNIVLGSDYERYVYDVKNTTGNSNNIGLARKPKNVYLQRAGILNGDSFIDNSFLTAELGVGIERVVNEKWSLFAQPTFKYHLLPSDKGLGPYNDKFDTFSFNIGTRMKL